VQYNKITKLCEEEKHKKDNIIDFFKSKFRNSEKHEYLNLSLGETEKSCASK